MMLIMNGYVLLNCFYMFIMSLRILRDQCAHTSVFVCAARRLSGMGPMWMLLCVCAGVVAASAAESDANKNISSIVNDPKRVPAYLDWDVGELLVMMRGTLCIQVPCHAFCTGW